MAATPSSSSSESKPCAFWSSPWALAVVYKYDHTLCTA
eukprot:CAMPEP_0198567056 /NCGR_PEP_ID=MMETSP1462-20131121/104186_1 /TAXON_ID=1333877 /ORGANISM="Brandtodinium nutriculum, Strain RCC3387" /LENGTH=37 /DNA_ID= /DNA_START= /DNA_END= /DNA_ORIENTATION=